ncbi:MAG: hypothetical protein ABFS14_12260 [Gemmatimonadota bacterium]
MSLSTVACAVAFALGGLLPRGALGQSVSINPYAAYVSFPGGASQSTGGSIGYGATAYVFLSGHIALGGGYRRSVHDNLSRSALFFSEDIPGTAVAETFYAEVRSSFTDRSKPESWRIPYVAARLGLARQFNSVDDRSVCESPIRCEGPILRPRNNGIEIGVMAGQALRLSSNIWLDGSIGGALRSVTGPLDPDIRIITTEGADFRSVALTLQIGLRAEY